MKKFHILDDYQKWVDKKKDDYYESNIVNT